MSDVNPEWLENLDQSLLSVYAVAVARQRMSPTTEPVLQAFVQGYLKACEDFAVSAEKKEAVLRRAGLGGEPCVE